MADLLITIRSCNIRYTWSLFYDNCVILSAFIHYSTSNFFQLIWSTLIGLLLFGESLDIFILIGGSFIVVAIVQLSSNEKLKKQKNQLK